MPDGGRSRKDSAGGRWRSHSLVGRELGKTCVQREMFQEGSNYAVRMHLSSSEA